ncbi:MAG TPA: response regulator [Vicinamibacterales bacterium]|jgi:FixJ family two-component response regulator
MPQILVVDDDQGTLSTFYLSLTHAGFGVGTAQSGAVALGLLQTWIPDLLLLDLHLNDMTGFAVMEQMQMRGIACVIAVMTGFPDLYLEEDAMKLGAAYYLHKPLIIDDMVGLIQGLLGTSRPPLSNTYLQPATCKGFERIDELHDRLLLGETCVLEGIAKDLLNTIPRMLRRAFPRTSHDILADATEDAVLDYARRPARFDRTRGTSLKGYIYTAAWRNVRDRILSESRRQKYETSYAHTKDQLTQQLNRESTREESDLRQEELSKLLAKTCSRTEQLAIDLWLDGAASTALAAVLGLSELPEGEQRQEVKRFKDRILKRLSRHHLS